MIHWSLYITRCELLITQTCTSLVSYIPIVSTSYTNYPLHRHNHDQNIPAAKDLNIVLPELDKQTITAGTLDRGTRKGGYLHIL